MFFIGIFEVFADTMIVCTMTALVILTAGGLEGGVFNVVPCKSSGALPKDKIFECMEVINKASAKAPVKLGDVLVSDILGTGIDIIATNHCPIK